MVVEYLGSRGHLPPPTGSGVEVKAAREAERLRRKLADAAELFATDRITADQLDQITGTLRAQLAAAESESAPPPVVSDAVRRVVKARDAAAAWAGANLLTRRDVIEVLGVRVRIRPTRPGPGFEPADVEFTWGEA